MADIRQQLQQFKQENHDLERELRSNANAEQKARLLEAKVTENLESIEQLRQERSLLAADHKELQRRYAKASEVRPSLICNGWFDLLIAHTGGQPSQERVRRLADFT